MKAQDLKSNRALGTRGPHLITVSPETLVTEALRQMHQHQVHHLLVMSQEEFLGIVSDRGILLKAWEGTGISSLAELRVKDAMRTGIPVIDETMDVGKALSLMAEKQLSALPIVRGQRICGILTESDMVRLLEEKLHKRALVDEVKERGEAWLLNPLLQNVIKALGDIGL